METKLWNVNHIVEARNKLAQGEIVAIPTETVYGLGADATNEMAVQKIFQAKGRPSDNPLIIHVANEEQMFTFVQGVPSYVSELIAHFSPGPITYVLPSNGKVAPAVTAGLSTVAVRIPDHPLALKLLHICDFPVAAPSANVSGKPSPTKATHVLTDMQGKIAGVIDGGDARSGLESTVIDCTDHVPVILRPGEITAKQIKDVVGAVRTTTSTQDDKPKSPGMKYKHYAPEVPFYLYIGCGKGQLDMAMEEAKSKNKRVGILTYGEKNLFQNDAHIYFIGENRKAVAHNLYNVLRTVSIKDVDVLFGYVHNENDLSEAIMDRLTRAATNVVRI